MLLVLVAVLAWGYGLRVGHGVPAVAAAGVALAIAMAARPGRSWWLPLSAALGLAVAVCWLTWITRQHALEPGCDTWVHVAFVLAGRHGRLLADPFFAGYPPPPYLSLTHAGMALASAVTGAAPLAVYLAFIAVAPGLLLLAALVYMHRLCGQWPMGLLGGTILLASLAGNWWELGNPFFLGLGLLWLAHAHWWRLAASPRPWPLAGLALMVGGSFYLHLFIGVMTTVSLAVCLLLDAPTWRDLGRPAWLRRQLPCALALAGGVLLAAPWLLAVALQALGAETSSEQFAAPQFVTTLSLGAWQLHLQRPYGVFQLYPLPVWLLAGLGLVLLARRSSAPPRFRRYLLAFSILPLVALFTPLYELGAALFGRWMMLRLAWLLPVPWLAAWAVATLARWLATAAPWPARVRMAASALTAGGLLAAVVGHGTTEVQRRLQTRYSLRNVVPLFAADADALAPLLAGQVVLADPITMYVLPAFTGAKVVAIAPAHASPYIDLDQRCADSLLLLRTATPPAQRESLLRRYGVTHFLINRNAHDPGIQAELERLGWFALVYRSPAMQVYQVRLPPAD